MYFLKKFRKSQNKSSRKSRKNSLRSKKSIKEKDGRCCIDERRESIQRKKGKFLQLASNCAAIKSLLFFVRWSILDVTELNYQKEAS